MGSGPPYRCGQIGPEALGKAGRVLVVHHRDVVAGHPDDLHRGVRSSDAALEAARNLVEQAGKQSITVNDSPGFVTNRAMMLMVNEAMFLRGPQACGGARVTPV
jgi:3-hydroxyacyl-CoA dehydrogenase